MPVVCAASAAICLIAAIIPAPTPTPYADAVLYGLAAFHALMAVVSTRFNKPPQS